MNPVIETKRLTLQKYEEEHFSFLFEMSSNPEVMRFIGNGEVWSQERTRDLLTKMLKMNQEGMGLFAILRKSDQAYIGHAGILLQEVDGVEETEVGYWIDSKYWGSGYATEAAQACRDYGFTQLKKGRLISIIHKGNHASIRVAVKNGMSLEKKTEFRGVKVFIYSIIRKK